MSKAREYLVKTRPQANGLALITNNIMSGEDWLLFAEEYATDHAESLQKRVDLLAEALAEIKATVDGKSKQPVKDIVYGCIEELKLLHQEK